MSQAGSVFEMKNIVGPLGFSKGDVIKLPPSFAS